MEPQKKIFIAMAGNIGAGKTTAAKLVSQKLGFELFDEPVIDNRFLRDYYANMGRWSFTLQLEFLIRRVEHHELIRTVPKSCIQDRTLYEDPEIFAKYLHGLGFMDDRELDLYFEYFHRLNRELLHPSLILMLSVERVSTLLERIRVRGRKEESGIDEAFLAGLNAYYSTFPQVCRKKYGIPIYEINVERLDIRSSEGQTIFLNEVARALKDSASVVVGQSGVGKTSLLNAVDPSLQLAVAPVSSENQKGRHTTTNARLIPVAGGYVVDTPGMRQFQPWDVIPEEVVNYYRDLRPYINHCKFPNCTHTHEADCAIKNAVADGRLDERRYASYCHLWAGDSE